MKAIKILFTALLMLVSLVSFAQAINDNEEYKSRVRSTLQLDYSMPDYTISRIDAKVMGPRLAAILNKIMECRGQQTTIATLSVIQTHQIDGLSYGRIKDIKLDKVYKIGNEIIICFNTTIDSNNFNLKRAQLRISFIDGVSRDSATNDFFSNICRYI